MIIDLEGGKPFTMGANKAATEVTKVFMHVILIKVFTLLSVTDPNVQLSLTVHLYCC